MIPPHANPSPGASLRMSLGAGMRTSGIGYPAYQAPEKPSVLAPATVLFLMMVAHSILETARDTLFLTRIGPDKLGWAYVGIAGVSLAAFMGFRKWGAVRGARAMLMTFLICALIGTTILAFALSATAWAAFILYVWTGTIASLMVPSFWLVIERDVRIGDAKKILSAIAAGGGLGALVGSAMASVLGHYFDPHNLVTAGAAMFGVATVATRILLPAARPERARRYPSA